MNNSENTSVALDSDIAVIDSYLNAVISGIKNPAQHVANEYEVKTSLVYSKINRNKTYIREKVEAYFKEASIDKLRVLQETKNIAYFNIIDIAYFNGDDMLYEDWKQLPREVTACIKDVTVVENTKTGIKTVHFSFYDKQKAIDQLIKILEIGAETINHKHSGNINYTQRLFDGVNDDMATINEDATSRTPVNDDGPIIEVSGNTNQEAA